jgi:hypothetical protein
MYADFNEDLSRIGPRRDYDARDFGTGDIPNRCLSAATSCLYGSRRRRCLLPDMRLADHGSAALRGSTLYTTGEPCAMCMDPVVSGQSAGSCRVRGAARDDPRSDYDLKRRYRREGSIRTDHDHRGRIGG